jgi:hypothetical protein
MVEATLETDLAEQIRGTTARMILAANLGGYHDVLQRRQGRQQLEALKDKTDKLVTNARKLLLAGAMQSDAVEEYRSVVGPFQTGADGNQSRFPAPRGADDGARAPRLDGERNIVEDLERLRPTLKKLGQMLYAEDRVPVHG